MFIINVDMDGVLCDSMQLTMALMARDDNIIFYQDKIDTFYYENDMFSLDEVIKRLTFKEENLILAPEVPGAVKFMGWLDSNEVHVRIATARHPKYTSVSEMWLKLHNIPYDQFISLGDNGKDTLDGEILIDDHHKNITDFILSGDNKYGILFPRPWNRKYHLNMFYQHSTKVIIPLGLDDHTCWENIATSVRLLMTYVGHDNWVQTSF